MFSFLEDLGRRSLRSSYHRPPHTLGMFYLLELPVFVWFVHLPVPQPLKTVLGVPAFFVALGLGGYLDYRLERRYGEQPTRGIELTAGTLVLAPAIVIGLYVAILGGFGEASRGTCRHGMDAPECWKASWEQDPAP